MSNSKKTIEWNPDESYYSKDIVGQRILSAISYRGWQYTVKLIHDLQIPFSQLKIAEVGCGTGTFALTFALLGASVTLIDSNEEALKNAEKIYKMYGCTTQCVKANVLDSPPDNLRKSFDVAISGGLAEHFIGKNLASCISFHRRLDIRRPDCTGQIESLAEKSNSSYKHNLLSDQFSAGIILFGFN